MDANLPEPRIDGALHCPACEAPMQTFSCKRKLEGELTLDLCFACQGIWFDEFESLQMAPAGVLELFKLIHAHHDDPRQPWHDVLDCPRCRERMLQGFDLSKNGRFSYHRCLQGHGRFTAFSAFMTEKGFVRQLNGAEIAALAQKIQIIRCSGCGAPVDIRTETVCGHCRAPIAILDPQAVEKALSGLNQAAAREERVDPEAFADALLANERLKSKLQRERAQASSIGVDVVDFDIADLVTGGIGLLVGLLHK
ncbi:MAG: zf-TFIIB domain-containing protein [Betaproteobacteria bacterium]